MHEICRTPIDSDPTGSDHLELDRLLAPARRILIFPPYSPCSTSVSPFLVQVLPQDGHPRLRRRSNPAPRGGETRAGRGVRRRRGRFRQRRRRRQRVRVHLRLAQVRRLRCPRARRPSPAGVLAPRPPFRPRVAPPRGPLPRGGARHFPRRAASPRGARSSGAQPGPRFRGVRVQWAVVQRCAVRGRALPHQGHRGEASVLHAHRGESGLHQRCRRRRLAVLETRCFGQGAVFYPRRHLVHPGGSHLRLQHRFLQSRAASVACFRPLRPPWRELHRALG